MATDNPEQVRYCDLDITALEAVYMVFLAILALAIAALSLLSVVLVGLVEAPWPVLLGGLLFALYGLQRLSVATPSGPPGTPNPVTPKKSKKPSTGASETPQASSEKNELIYRGIRYKISDPTTDMAPKPDVSKADDNTVEGVYRGKHWQHPQQPALRPSSTNASSEITYRGCKVIRSKESRD